MRNTIPLIIVSDPDEPGAAEVYVDGAINGQPRRFLLDTGAARSAVAADPLTETLPAHGEHHSSGVFEAMRDTVVLLDTLELGSVHHRNLLVTRAAGAEGRGNLIGMDVLKDHRCDFYFSHAQLVIDPPAQAGEDVWQVLQMDSKAHPYVAVSADGVPANAVWDSGASLTVADLGFIQRNPALFTEAGTSTGTDAGGAQVVTTMFVMAAIRVGGTAFAPHRVAGVDLSLVNAAIEIPMDLILGYNLISGANWRFDFPGRRYRIEG